MPVGKLETEGDVARFVAALPADPRINALQGHVAALEGKVQTGSGSPEGVVTAPVGTLFLRDDGGAGTTLWVKESGTADTGWAAK